MADRDYILAWLLYGGLFCIPASLLVGVLMYFFVLVIA